MSGYTASEWIATGIGATVFLAVAIVVTRCALVAVRNARKEPRHE